MAEADHLHQDSRMIGSLACALRTLDLTQFYPVYVQTATGFTRSSTAEKSEFVLLITKFV